MIGEGHFKMYFMKSTLLPCQPKKRWVSTLFSSRKVSQSNVQSNNKSRLLLFLLLATGTTELWMVGWMELIEGIKIEFFHLCPWTFLLPPLGFSEARCTPQPPATTAADAPGHEAPARTDKGFNSRGKSGVLLINTDMVWWAVGCNLLLLTFPGSPCVPVSVISALYFCFSSFSQYVGLCVSSFLCLILLSSSRPVWVRTRQAGLSSLLFYVLFSISVAVKQKIAALGVFSALLCSRRVGGRRR